MPAKPCITCGTLSRHNYCPAHSGNRTQRNGSTRKWRGLRATVIARDGGRCRVCGAATQLQVHHLDGNPHNDVPENLQTACKACHNALRRPAA